MNSWHEWRNRTENCCKKITASRFKRIRKQVVLVVLSKRLALKIWIINELYLTQSLLTLRFENQEFLIPRDHLILSSHLTQILLQFLLVCKQNQTSMFPSLLLKSNHSYPHPGYCRIILRLWICRLIEVVVARLRLRKFTPL